MEILEKRRKMAIYLVVLAASLLDHRYSGLHLSPIEVQEAMQYTGEINNEFLPQPEVSTLIARHEPFKEDLFSDAYKNLSPATWWNSGVKLGFNSDFAVFSSALIESFTSSAGLERQCSTIGMNYGKLRSVIWMFKKQGNGIPLSATELCLSEVHKF